MHLKIKSGFRKNYTIRWRKQWRKKKQFRRMNGWNERTPTFLYQRRQDIGRFGSHWFEPGCQDINHRLFNVQNMNVCMYPHSERHCQFHCTKMLVFLSSHCFASTNEIYKTYTLTSVVLSPNLWPLDVFSNTIESFLYFVSLYCTCKTALVPMWADWRQTLDRFLFRLWPIDGHHPLKQKKNKKEGRRWIFHFPAYYAWERYLYDVSLDTELA